MIAKCRDCFWNYNCPMANGDELNEDEYQYVEKCDKMWQNKVREYRYEVCMSRTEGILDKIPISKVFNNELRNHIALSDLMDKIEKYCSKREEFKAILEDRMFNGEVFNWMDRDEFLDYLRKRYGREIKDYETVCLYIEDDGRE